DLFDKDVGVIATTTMDGKEISGVNSKSPAYKRVDEKAAKLMRAMLIEKYPDVMALRNVGEMPNNALFHAEATALLRAARENGGKLTNRNLVVAVDKDMCPNCEEVLPLLTPELGSPQVSFVDRLGRILGTIKDGKWLPK